MLSSPSFMMVHRRQGVYVKTQGGLGFEAQLWGGERQLRHRLAHVILGGGGEGWGGGKGAAGPRRGPQEACGTRARPCPPRCAGPSLPEGGKLFCILKRAILPIELELRNSAAMKPFQDYGFFCLVCLVSVSCRYGKKMISF